MTKTIVLGEKKDESNKKPIEFFSLICIANRDDVDTESADDILPSEFKYIELICKNYVPNLDLMFAYDDDNRGYGRLFIGRWNDGVVK